MIVYHHNDLDGMSGAYVVREFAPKTGECGPSSYYACDYNSEFDKHTSSDDVVIVDLSFSKGTYDKFMNICRTARSVTWIDHHASSIDMANEYKEELQSIRNLTYFLSDKYCGSALAFIYFHTPRNMLYETRNTEEGEEYIFSVKESLTDPTKYNISKEMQNRLVIMGCNKISKGKLVFNYNIEIALPLWLAYVDDFDCWKLITRKSNYFQLGVYTAGLNFVITDDSDEKIFSPVWDKIIYVDTFIKDGEAVYRFNENKYKEEFGDTFVWEYKGKRILCKNAISGNGYNFLDRMKEYDAAMIFYYSAKIGKWSYGIYADKLSDFNCKEFAEKFGGGGHKGAAGFRTKDLLFTDGFVKETEDVIFLGGTYGEFDWRSEFIAKWKKYAKDNKELSKLELFNPIVPDWDESCIKKENEIKKVAKANLFVITPDMEGCYSIAEAIDCVHYSKTFLFIYDKDNKFTDNQLKSFNAVGKLLEDHEGVYGKYIGIDSMDELVNDLIKAF